MASYTMTLGNVIEDYDLGQVGSTSDRIESGRAKLFDFDYPIFDPNYKKTFETHFIRRFYMREIGFETEGLFKFNLETWLDINMPYFNNLFKSELLTFDPLSNTKMDISHSNTKNGTANTKGSSSSSQNSNNSQTGTDTGFQRDIHADTPDSRLQLTTNNGSGVIEYASDIDEHTQNNSNSVSATGSGSGSANSNVDNTINQTDTYTENRSGKVGSQTFSDMLNDYRSSFIRIENMIFKEMEQLFMLVY